MPADIRLSGGLLSIVSRIRVSKLAIQPQSDYWSSAVSMTYQIEPSASDCLELLLPCLPTSAYPEAVPPSFLPVKAAPLVVVCPHSYRSFSLSQNLPPKPPTPARLQPPPDRQIHPHLTDVIAVPSASGYSIFAASITTSSCSKSVLVLANPDSKLMYFPFLNQKCKSK